ncbi:MAG: hypothetical protein HY481_00140 [Candidatus Vogelbacteria bacterium]|nr:hypothetical protein [Candidatus Vogelbacteria bacterium]
MEPGVVKLLEPGVVNRETVSSLTEYLSIIFPTLIALAATLAIIMIVIGGLEYIFSMVPGKKEEGLKRIKEAIWGLVLALAAYLILKTINPDLVTLRFVIPS